MRPPALHRRGVRRMHVQNLNAKVVLVEAKEGQALDQKTIGTALISAVALAISGSIQWRNRTAPVPGGPAASRRLPAHASREPVRSLRGLGLLRGRKMVRLRPALAGRVTGGSEGE